ncbi:MAG: class I SAM-dependent methyltransferase [Rhodospirillaceae bacterium]|nr:class I SAM-dependent methyltransferase [Rhodospirillaceae bacterium]
MLDERIFRRVRQSKVPEFESFLASDFVTDQVAAGSLVETWRLSNGEAARIEDQLDPPSHGPVGSAGGYFEHERVNFISYPYEWPAEMCHEAAALTLDLALGAMPAGYRLKDATPYNVLFRGPKPVFVDMLSFEQRQQGNPLWPAEGQFLRMFLLPLLAEKRFGLFSSDLLATHRDGIQPDLLYRLFSKLALLSPLALRYVALPVWLAGKADNPALYEQQLLDNADRADFVYERILRRLQRALGSLKPGREGRSHWSGYMGDHSYSDEAFAQKETFVGRALEISRPARVLDIGANTGHFSFLAAKQGASVIALDTDAKSVGEIWRQASERQLDVLPLLQNIADPRPSLGWRNRETKSFLDRARGQFDLVLMLALIHHLTLTHGIPIEQVVDLAADITTGYCVIEYVGADDPMRQQLRRGRMEIDAAMTKARFETACRPRFQIEEIERVGDADRWLYLLKRHDG